MRHLNLLPPFARRPMWHERGDHADPDSSAFKEIVTAALLLVVARACLAAPRIAEYLTAVGIDLKGVRVVGDEERAIVDALNALRHRWTYVFTIGGIAHGDITADCVAKAFGVPI